MTRDEFKLQLIGKQPRYIPRSHPIRINSVTDPSFAMTGAQIVANTMRGIPVSSPINLEYNGIKNSDVTSFDKPIKERMDVIDYTRKKLKETDDVTLKAYNEMIKQIDNQQKQNNHEN